MKTKTKQTSQPWVPPFLSYGWIETKLWVMETANPNSPLNLIWIFFSSLITSHSISVTHHLKYPTPYTPLVITHLSLLNIFQLFVGPTHWPNVNWLFSLSLFFFFFPCLSPSFFSAFLFVFPYFSLLFSSSMLTHILIRPTMILIFMLFPDLQ